MRQSKLLSGVRKTESFVHLSLLPFAFDSVFPYESSSSSSFGFKFVIKGIIKSEANKEKRK